MAPKLHFCTFKKLPEKGTPGHLFLVKDSPKGTQLLMAASNGVLCPVTELFNLQITEVPGRDGKDGKDGRDGVDGAPGAQGPKGEKGDITVVGDAELQTAVASLKKQKAQVLGRMAMILGRRGTAVAEMAKQHVLALKKDLES